MNKKQPQKCESKICCKATAQLNTEIVDELMKEDKSLSELLEKEDEKDGQGKDTKG
ncbi:hypothetical protein OAK92_01720 [Crocinitomicaceae bacterium]|nr:hypothetical protein [Crocinitomicaceae bacterium]